MHKTDDLAVVAKFKDKLDIQVEDSGKVGERLQFSVLIGDQKYHVWMGWSSDLSWNTALLTAFEVRGTTQERFSCHAKHESLEAALTFLSTISEASVK